MVNESCNHVGVQHPLTPAVDYAGVHSVVSNGAIPINAGAAKTQRLKGRSCELAVPQAQTCAAEIWGGNFSPFHSPLITGHDGM